MTTAYFDAIAGYARTLITHLGLVGADGQEISGVARRPVSWTPASDGQIGPTKDLLFTIPPHSVVAGWHGYSNAEGGIDYGGEDLIVETFNGHGEYLLKATGTGIVHRASRG